MIQDFWFWLAVLEFFGYLIIIVVGLKAMWPILKFRKDLRYYQRHSSLRQRVKDSH